MSPSLSQRVIGTLRWRAPWLARWLRHLRPRAVRRRRRFRGKDLEGVFTEIYEHRLWDSSESVSGSGSTLAATESLRRELAEIVASLEIRVLLDAPCGDFYWMSQADLDLERYIGGEIVRPLVDELNERYADGVRRFVHLDITSDPLPDADAFLCRDCMLHLPNREVVAVLDNARRSSCRYLLASTYPDCPVNVDIEAGLARPINLCRPPFDLPPALATLTDPGGGPARKCLGVWDLDRLR